MKRTIEIFVSGKKIGHIQYELAELEPGVTYTEPMIRVKVSGEIPAVSPPNFTKFDTWAAGGNADAAAFENYMAEKLTRMKGSGAQEFSAMLNVPAESVTFKVGPKGGGPAGDESNMGLWAAIGLGLGALWLYRRKRA
jgi:hypothetical protein